MKKSLSILALALVAIAGIFAAPKQITVVWYPNNSSEDWKAGRQAIDDMIAKATGMTVIDKLTTESQVNGGACFYFSLPRRQARPAAS